MSIAKLAFGATIAAVGFALFLASVVALMMWVEPPTQWVPYHYEQGYYEADWPID